MASQRCQPTCSLSSGTDSAVTMSGADRKIAYASASESKRTAYTNAPRITTCSTPRIRCSGHRIGFSLRTLPHEQRGQHEERQRCGAAHARSPASSGSGRTGASAAHPCTRTRPRRSSMQKMPLKRAERVVCVRPLGRGYHCPTLGMDFHGSAGGSAPPFCSSSTEMLSGERTKAMCPSRGGRLMATP